jgi:hypothetical protein
VQHWADTFVDLVMQPSQILPATTDKFKSVTGLTAGLNYYATVCILHDCALPLAQQLLNSL